MIKIEDGVLSLVPTVFAFANNKGKSLVSGFQYKSFFKLPFSVTFDIKASDSQSFRLFLEKMPSNDDYNRTIFIVNGLNDNTSPLDVRTVFVENNDKSEDIFVEKNISLDRIWKKSFRILGPNVKINNRFLFSINYGYEPNLNRKIEPLKITRMEFLARFVPMIGVTFNEKDSIVFAKSLVDGRPAMKAGLKEGDVIKSINNQEIKKSIDAVNIIGETAIGEEVSIKVERRGEIKEIKIKTDL